MQKELKYKNVIITSLPLAGIGWFSSILSKIMGMKWNYEISRFECTRFRRKLPEGYNTVWNADPEILVKRGFDRVICLQRKLEEFYFSHAIYHRTGLTNEQILAQEPDFFENIKAHWDMFEKDFTHKNYLKVSLEDLNTYTVDTFMKVLDFLGYDYSDVNIVPVKVARNWELHSNIEQKKGDQLKPNLQDMKNIMKFKKNPYLWDVNK